MTEVSGPRRVVYTVLYENYEDLLPQPQVRDSHIEAICFTDDPQLTSEDWHVVHVPRRLEGDVVRSQRALKVLFFEHLSQFDEILYIDNSVELKSSPEAILDHWLQDYDIALIKHSFRKRLVDEFDEVARLNYDDVPRVHEQLWDYARTQPQLLEAKPLWTGIIARRNVPAVQAAMREWFEHILRYSRRDQLSLLWALSDRSIRINLLSLDNSESEWHRWSMSPSRRVAQGKRPPLPSGPMIADLLRSEERLADVLEENRTLREDLDRCLSELEAQRGENAKLFALTAELQKTRDQLALIESSTTWRATAPIRRISDFLSREG